MVNKLNKILNSLKNNMEARAEHQKVRHYQTFYSFTTSMGVGLLALVLFWILYYRSGFAWQKTPSQEFYWHPFLMVLGMVFLYSQSMLVYRSLRHVPKMKLKIIHASLHGLAFILSVIGLKAAFDSHNLVDPPKPNLYSLHSWIGLATVIIFALQFLIGFLSFLYPGISINLRKALMPVHTSFGIGCFILAIVTTLTGVTEKVLWTLSTDYQKYPSEGILINLIGVFTVFYGVMVLYMVNEMDYKRVATVEDDIPLSE
ncbi:transmembrane ascorbate-dependent reductase CYB561 isoform X2 [Leptinotarsa decemlineata]|uniref:transmembrane ascorbate-dependent reductase CYB561 isoform X2 n=1 Tax=Leptinotarsa decemlineata TaxID=7539 RepID=UPI003D305E87